MLARVENHPVEPGEHVLLSAMRANRARGLELQQRDEKLVVERAGDGAAFVADEVEDAVFGFSEDMQPQQSTPVSSCGTMGRARLIASISMQSTSPRYSLHVPKPNRPTKAQIRSAFGKAIRSLRLKTGLSQEKLAHELKIDRGNLASAEAGRHNPTLYTVWTLLPGLRVSVTEFFAGFDRNRR